MVKEIRNKPNKSSNQLKNSTDHRKTQKKHVEPRRDEHLEQIPFRLREIMKSKERMNMGAKKLKKMRAANLNAQRESSDDIPVPRFRRGKQESESAYLQRMSRETEHVLFLTNNQTVRQPELQLEETETATKQKSEKKKLFDKGKLERLHKKKLNQKEEKAEKQMFKDDVQFGEVAMEPPTLTAKPRKAPGKSQGGSRDLLLNSLLGQTAPTVKPSMARQRIMEEERERVVQAYRLLKKQKLEQQEKQKNTKNKTTRKRE